MPDKGTCRQCGMTSGHKLDCGERWNDARHWGYDQHGSIEWHIGQRLACADCMVGWACKCGPHLKQIWDTLPGNQTSVVPLLCFEHKRHNPCRKCRWEIT